MTTGRSQHPNIESNKPGKPDRHFRNLIHWQKGQALAADVLRLVRGLPKEKAFDTLGNQLLRSAGSVPANIAEGYGRFSAAAYRNHLSIARGSLFETQSWLDLLQRDHVVPNDVVERLDSECEELARILTARMRALDTPTTKILREEGPDYEF